MQRILKTPIQSGVSSNTPRMPGPYLQLESEIHTAGQSIAHQMLVTLPDSAPEGTSVPGRIMGDIERMVEVPSRLPWSPRIARLAIHPYMDFGGPNMQVLEALHCIRGVHQGLGFQYLGQQAAMNAYVMQVERGSVSIEIAHDSSEVTRFRVSKVALAAAGLRLAAATTLMDITPIQG